MTVVRPVTPTSARGRRHRTGHAVLAGLALAGLLVACAPTAADDVADPGYQSGDGTASTWPVGDRKGPVTVAGTDYEGQGVHVLGINSTDGEGAAVPFQTTFDIPYPSIEDTDGSAVAALQGVVPVNAVPTTVVLDQEGKVAARILGLVDPSTLRSVVDELLDEPAAT